jgi:hypothetical protein
MAVCAKDDDASMASVADMHEEVDDDLAAISPELALVDPELARRLRERERTTVVDVVAPSPWLRLVPRQEEVVEEPESELEPETGVAPFEPEPEVAPEPLVVVPIHTEVETEDLIVPRPAEVESPAEAARANHPLAAIAARRQMVVTEPAHGDHLGTDVAAEPEPIAAAHSSPVAVPVVARPSRRPRRWRRRMLSVMLAAGVATAITIGVMAAMGEPLSTADVPGRPIADESSSGEATPNQPSTEAPTQTSTVKPRSSTPPRTKQKTKPKPKSKPKPKPAAAAP